MSGWWFFKKYYLESMPSGVWYKPPLFESPDCHYQYTYNIHAFPRVVAVFPRSFAKTFLMRENVLRWALTIPFFRVLIIKSRDDFVREDFQAMMFQIENNPRIIQDFGVLKPKRGKGQWTQNRWFLANGFQLAGRSVTSTLLGFRPNAWFLDDVEYDPVMQAVPTNFTEGLRNLLFHHLEPTLDQGCIGIMQGTLVSRKALLYEAATARDEEEPRWVYWHRTILPAKLPDGTLTWPEKFSEERLQEKKEQLGHAAYAAQMLNAPASEADQIFKIHPLLGRYTIQNPDAALRDDPFNSGAILSSWIMGSETQEDDGGPVLHRVCRPFGKTIATAGARYILVDPAKVERSDRDFSAVICVFVEHSSVYKDTYWVLDLEMGKINSDDLLDIVWNMALKWKANVVGVESVAAQIHLVNKMRGDFVHRSEAKGWMPFIQAINYKGELNKSKAARIMGLAWRFDQHRIKIPECKSFPWTELQEEIENFTSDLKLLRYDDAIDALAMTQFVAGSASPHHRPTKADELEDPMSLLARGITHFPNTKMKILNSVNAKDLTPEAIAGIQGANRRKQKRQRGRLHIPRISRRMGPRHATTPGDLSNG